MSDGESLRAKVDGYLREALATSEGPEKTALIAKAAYWNQKSQFGSWKARTRPANPWLDRRPRA